MKKTLIAALVISAASSFAQTPTTAPVSAEPPAPQNSDLDAVGFYNILRAELFNFEGDIGSAFRVYRNLARSNPSDQLFERATSLLLNARDGDTARNVATEWATALPESALAQYYLFQINFAQGQYPNIVTPLGAYLRLTKESDRAAAILGLTRYFTQIEQKQAAANELTKALAPYIESSASIAATKAAARITTARTQVEATRYNEALVQLKALTTESPTSIDGWLLKGALELQENLFADADTSYQQFLQLADKTNIATNHPGRIQAYLGLAQLAENRKDYDTAQSWLGKIEDDKERLAAQLRRASIMAKLGKVDEARALIQQLPEQTRAQSRAKLLGEAHLLRDHGKVSDAILLLDKAIADKQPDEPKDADLLYELSTLYEKTKNYDKMEALLREAIALQPNSAVAYNALGYSLADRGLRLEEAKALIEQALKITPGDPYIIDSLAWALYRIGRMDESLKTFQIAYKIRADAEIGAHMGEVFWAMNRRDEAIKIWKEAQIINRDNPTLIETLKRFGVKL